MSSHDEDTPRADQRAEPTGPGAHPDTGFHERGRAYVQAMAPTFVLAALGHGEFVRPGHTPADEIMSTVLDGANDAEDLRNFVEGVADEVTQSLIGLIRRPLLHPQE